MSEDTTTSFKNVFDYFAEHDAKVAAYGPVKSWLYHHSLAGKNGLYLICHPFYAAKEIPSYYWRESKWRRQRGRDGYSGRDVWGLDHYILSWLPEAIGELHDMNNGHPMGMTNDEWLKILSTIREGLVAGREYDDILLDQTDEEAEERLLKFQAAWNLMGEHFFSLWD
jgi:hypothetical protein